MASSGQPTAQQMASMQQQLSSEAAKRGMTPEQFSNMRKQQVAADAAKQGMTPEQYINQLKSRALQQHQQQQQAAQQGQGQQQEEGEEQQGQQSSGPDQKQVPVNAGGQKDPRAIAVANFLRSQNLKARTCVLEGRRRELFKVKRAIRAIESPEYAKAAAKRNSNLPPVKDRASAENAFKLLPMSLLALRVTKSDPHEGHDHAKPPPKKNRVKGLWTVNIEQQQEADPMMHYVWLYDGPQWKQKAYAAGVMVLVMSVVMFPLWPMVLRRGVWYLSVGAMGLLGLFFAMSIFRLILFCATIFTVPPGFWLFPNLFEDVGFVDSFKPLWGWQETKKKKKSKPADDRPKKTPTSTSESAAQPTKENTASTTQSNAIPFATDGPTKRSLAARVEDAEDE